MSGASQPAEKLNAEGFVTGHDFNRVDNVNRMSGASQAAEKLNAEGLKPGTTSIVSIT